MAQLPANLPVSFVPEALAQIALRADVQFDTVWPFHVGKMRFPASQNGFCEGIHYIVPRQYRHDAALYRRHRDGLVVPSVVTELYAWRGQVWAKYGCHAANGTYTNAVEAVRQAVIEAHPHALDSANPAGQPYGTVFKAQLLGPLDQDAMMLREAWVTFVCDHARAIELATKWAVEEFAKEE